ncbi:acyl-CoA carboxylase epsilon subunit [Homoserinibacter sp. GY 40078]|uniref:acyl-CoA carboxylase epsilon subunit n=1 Tax=Homoserinibacter sp. GY 40078 TaxID=2603275 RepID=UPI0011CA5185|nr:acyl-CoA carboxylase epsilon subunit [Homoserinibacter sp. GY 40078]TXK16234.1 acyl-CoA carboxylase subunit epsilon [Homoserinibacter sp. GY 40078]
MSEERQPDQTLRVLGGDPTPEELAAASAVLQAALDEFAGMQRMAGRRRSAWERNRRGLRQPLERGSWTTWAS